MRRHFNHALGRSVGYRLHVELEAHHPHVIDGLMRQQIGRRFSHSLTEQSAVDAMLEAVGMAVVRFHHATSETCRSLPSVSVAAQASAWSAYPESRAMASSASVSVSPS